VTGDVVYSRGDAKTLAAGAGGRDPRLFRLFASVRQLDGVGPTMLDALRRLLGREEPRLLDLLLQPPLGQRCLDALDDLSQWADGARVTLWLRIERHHPVPPKSRAPYRVTCIAGDIPIDLVFFRAREAYLNEQFPVDGERLVHGRLSSFRERWQMAHPEIVPDDPIERQRTAMVYALSEGLTQTRLKKLLVQAVEAVPDLPEWLDRQLLQDHALPSFGAAIAGIHGVDQETGPDRARTRLALDELLATQLALGLTRQAATVGHGRSTTSELRLTRALLASLPYRPTNAQARAIDEIGRDIAGNQPMLRLLMGDVGSGKTLVALAVMLQVVEAGRQAVLMAPTEVLARQHAKGLRELTAGIGVEVGLLVGNERGGARDRLLEDLAAGRLKLVVGTHALFQEQVAFADLALAVIDEQHRFGVHQRLRLVDKGTTTDLLLMTATPIPRSLVMAYYGDVEVSRLDEKPPGRQSITTIVLPTSRFAEVVAAIERALAAGDRAYWVCPVIEQALDDAVATAEDRFERLTERFGTAVALVHGRMKAAEKDAAMTGFATGATQLLVATTVIEVGVDVPEATVIVIDAAERFGLAQLHQLRGRVGRGSKPSTAILLYNMPLSNTARRRLQVMRKTQDGFRIAEEDLSLRGPGEILGSRQSGVAHFRVADLARDKDLLELARRDVRQILQRDPLLTSPRGRALRLLLQLTETPLAPELLSAG